jgi:SAM-dependent methyltransferase
VAPTNTKQAEKEYLGRTGSTSWEQAKPFSPPGADTLNDSASLLHDFAAALLTLQPSPDDLILDLGAGACWCSDLLGRLNRSSVALDISLDMLRAGRARPGRAIRAVAGDMESLPFRDGVFQKAICLSAMHHVPNIGAAVREVSRVLADEGVALFSEPGQGHAEASVSTAAMRDFGVLEQDIVIGRFMSQCHDAGFEDVRVKPLSYTVPGFDLTLDQWEAWSRLAASKRPRRALAKMALAAAELFGFGKRGVFFEETLAISFVRTLRPVIEHHPIIVASKTRALVDSGARWRAEIVSVESAAEARCGGTLDMVVRATNTGSAIWRTSSRSDIGHVRLGVQLLDGSGRLVARDYHRVALPHAVASRGGVTVTFSCPVPQEPGRYALKLDFVAEGVTWFETAGSVPVSRPLDARLEP